MMVAGAAMGPARTAALAAPQQNGRDLLFSSKFFAYSDGNEEDKQGKDHGYVGDVYDHFSSFSGYRDDGHDSEPYYVKDHGSTVSSATCSSYASAQAYQAGSNAHAEITKHAIMEFCKPDWDGKIKHVHDYAIKHAGAVAKAITGTQADCVSKGNAFGCASATAAAEAWAAATAEAHAYAVASAYDKCQELYPSHCKVNTGALSVAQASTYIELAVEAFSDSEVYACTKGDSHAWAAAYSKCAASAYAKVWTKAYAKSYLLTGCAKSDAAAQVGVETGAEWFTIEHCEKDGDAYSSGYAADADWTTYGSDANAFAGEVFHY